VRESIELFFPSIKFPLDADFKPLALDKSKKGKYADNLCILLFEAAFKEYRVEIKRVALKMNFNGHAVQLSHLSKSDRDSLAESGAFMFAL
jgi:hypothetical protein